ncbi:rCG43143 [Rattus norvegicus]|uniref:RCG43143 n=1 Tax=Rattus norvegicus TaxID=10116 RepID=A6IWC0_RAT|nr:rCG43143 [Rattus norvegicus]
MTAWRKFKSLLLPLVLAVLCAGLLTAAKANTSLPSASNQGESIPNLLTFVDVTERQAGNLGCGSI